MDDDTEFDGELILVLLSDVESILTNDEASLGNEDLEAVVSLLKQADEKVREIFSSESATSFDPSIIPRLSDVRSTYKRIENLVRDKRREVSMSADAQLKAEKAIKFYQKN